MKLELDGRQAKGIGRVDETARLASGKSHSGRMAVSNVPVPTAPQAPRLLP